MDAEVRDYIFQNPTSAEYLQKLSELLKMQIAMAQNRACEGLHIAVGCTGGRHRSVAVAEFLAKELEDHEILMIHRDIKRG